MQLKSWINEESEWDEGLDVVERMDSMANSDGTDEVMD